MSTFFKKTPIKTPRWNLGESPRFHFGVSLVFIFIFLFSGILYAQEYNSSDFKVSNPVIDPGGGFSQSANYQLQGSIGQISIGPSVSAGFRANLGFEYFSFVSSPIISSVAGDSQATISWTAATSTLGWTVGGYNLGQAAASGGPYTFTSVGNVTSKIAAPLANGTTYYFVVQVLDALGNAIATSGEVSAIPVSSGPPPATTCTDHSATNYGGALPCTYPPSPIIGGGGVGITVTGVNFSGRAYPNSTVTLLKDAQVTATTVAGPDSNFQINISGLSGGNYFFSVYSEDNNGVRSSLLTFPVSVTSGATTNVSGIFIAPTIAVDKSEVKRGDNIAIFGQSTLNANIIISVNSDQEIFATTSSDKNGVYLYNMDTSVLEIDKHTAQSKSSLNGNISSFSSPVSFLVGDKNVPVSKVTCPVKGDLNGDCHVNLVDFSIAAYWYHRILSGTFKAVEKSELNGDGKIDLTDFSIMAYYWTG